MVYGGAMGTLADTAVVYALLNLVQPGERVVTAGELIAEAHIINKGEKLAIAEMEVKNEQEKLIAKGPATYMILKNK